HIPTPRCIYLADDTQHDAAGLAAVMACLDGARTVLGTATGLYGYAPAIGAAIAGGHAYWFWQCGRREDLINGGHLYQHNHAQTTIAGVTCDITDILTPDYGQNLENPMTTPTEFRTELERFFQLKPGEVFDLRYGDSDNSNRDIYATTARILQAHTNTLNSITG